MFDQETAVAWTAMPYRASVVGADGGEIGRAESLLGDETEDIFHGIVINRESDHQHVEVAAVRIKRITEQHVITDLAADEVEQLPQYREERWYHLGWGGLFRKRPEWER